MTKTYIALIALAGLLIAAGPASSAQVEGTIQGFNCVTTGKTCPAGKEDPVIAAERVFVLYTSEGSYYFVPNLDRAVMARHIREQVRITGDMNPNYKSINAKSLEVRDNDNWNTAWSLEMQRNVEGSFNISGF